MEKKDEEKAKAGKRFFVQTPAFLFIRFLP